MDNSVSFVVRSLTCKRDFKMAVTSYNSFLSNCQQSVKLIVHTDGSLSKDDINILYDSVPNVNVIDRKDQEEYVKDYLSKYPKCLKLRNETPLSNKILDIPILEKHCVRFIDCDILFLRPFSGLFSNDASSRFCLEDDTGCSGRLIDMIKASSNKILEGCNVGIFQMNKDLFDIDYIEWFLSNDKLCVFPGMLDQTLYSIFMGSGNSQYYKYEQISTSQKKITISQDTIALHFMNDLKKLFFEYDNNRQILPSQENGFFQLEDARSLKYPYVIKRALSRRISKLFKP